MTSPPKSAAKPKPEILSIRDLRAPYPGEWLLIKVLGEPGVSLGDTPGELLAHGPSRAAMFRKAMKVRELDPTASLTILGGGTGFEDGEELRRALARVAREGKWVRVNPW